MIETMGAYKSTRYSCVYWRGGTLYYTFRNPQRRKIEVRYGEGSPADAREAQRIAQENADAVRCGVKDPRKARAEEASRADLSEVVDQYREHLKAKGGDHLHIRTVSRYIERWSTTCAVLRVTDADPARLVRWLGEQKWSARTRNYARSSILGFLRWTVDYGRAPYNPCPSGLVPKSNEDADRKRLSRALLPVEFNAMLAVAPPDRKAYYLILGNTGLRWRELGRLEWSDIDFDRGVLVVPASAAKNDRRAEIPLAPPVVEELNKWREKSRGLRLFAQEPRLKTWIRDLIRAGLVRAYCEVETRRLVMPGYVDDRGRRIDRKCLRLSFGTWLKDAGVDLRDTQRLMRHSDPKLTANIYTDPRMAPLRAAVEKLSTTNQPKISNSSDGTRRIPRAGVA